MRLATDWIVRASLSLLLIAFVGLSTGASFAATITVVSETFDGYTDFPTNKPSTDSVNLGVPLVSEGADSNLWLAARFGPGGNPNGTGSINADVGVQRRGSSVVGENQTPVGRIGDTAGLVLRLDLTGLRDVTLDFDWRTYLAEDPDRFVVAYYEGDGTEFQAGGLGNPNGRFDWFNDPELGNGSTAWYTNNWVELMQGAPDDQFKHESFSLPGDSVVYLAFRMDGAGDLDFGKFDNVVIRARPIPEPGTILLAALALGTMLFASRRETL